jgi:hypothetical protein
MADRDFESFEQFWDYYVGEHKEKTTRLLHFIGTTAAMGCLAGGLLTKRRWLLLLAPIVGYGPAWIGHFFVEMNKPATFGHPAWALRADLRMWWKTLSGEMQAEVERVIRQEDAERAAARSATRAAAAAVN